MYAVCFCNFALASFERKGDAKQLLLSAAMYWTKRMNRKGKPKKILLCKRLIKS